MRAAADETDWWSCKLLGEECGARILVSDDRISPSLRHLMLDIRLQDHYEE